VGYKALKPSQVIKSLNVSREIDVINSVLSKTEWYEHEDRVTAVIQIKDFPLTVHQRGAIKKEFVDAGWFNVTFREETNPNAINITFHKEP